MAIKAKYEYKHADILKDTRPWAQRFADKAKDPGNASSVFAMCAIVIIVDPTIGLFSDLIFLVASFYFIWLISQKTTLPFKLPKSAKRKDPNNKKPGGGIGDAEGIFYLGNTIDDGEEIWFNNNDIRTHVLFLGTTGSGKTFGLRSFACNALTWASGYVYIDGKADTDLWSALSTQARRFGRDDDLLIMNYMTGNVAGRVASNTLNPFSSGSGSYLTNMMSSLMPDGGGDNAMWKERAISLISALMPALIYKRDKQNIPMSIGMVRTFLTFQAVIKLSRDKNIPQEFREPLFAYLEELPGYVDDAFDEDGNEKPPGPDGAQHDTSTPRQQHGYLSMQFTRSMSSLGDDYGFIFDTQAADIDMFDVVINRRLLVVLIPALEKSGDETANLGKIIASALKGMMGATLGNTVEGSTATAIENKPTTSSTPFITIFDEVGYYAAQGMAVMAAQARSLGFCLIFAAQDMPALEKRVKEEARSITANCNVKLFGKLEDPTQTKEFFEKTVGQSIVTEVSGFEKKGAQGYSGSSNASVQVRARASYDGLKAFNEGKAICCFGEKLAELEIYYNDIGHARALRVHKFLPIPPPSEEALKALQQINVILKRFLDPKWDASEEPLEENQDILALARGFSTGGKIKAPLLQRAALSVASVAEAHSSISPEDIKEEAPAPTPITPKVSSRSDTSVVDAAASKAVADATNTDGDDMSWTALMGSPDATSTTSDTVDTEEKKSEGFSWEDLISSVPPVEESEKEAAEEIGAPISWADIMGTEIPRTPDITPEETIPTKTVETAETNTSDDADFMPMNWEDIIGTDTSSEDGKETTDEA